MENIQFKRNSLNENKRINILDSLVKVNYNSWIGFNKRGFQLFPSYNFKIISLAMILDFMEEKENARYYELIKKSCLKGDESWQVIESLSREQLRKFYNYSGYKKIKLRKLKLLFNKVDYEDTYTKIKINELAKVLMHMGDAYKNVKIYPTTLWEERDFSKIAFSLTDKLIGLGVNYENIEFIPQKKAMDPNEKMEEDYYFIIEIPRWDKVISEKKK